MLSHWKALRVAAADTLRYFREMRPIHLLLWLVAGLFLGWNGLQFLIADRYLFLFLDRLSFSVLALHIVQGKMAIPFYLVLLGGLIVFWLLRAMFETILLDWTKSRDGAAPLRRGMVFGINAVGFIMIFAVVLAGVFLIPYLIHIVYRPYPLRYALSLRYSLIFASIESIVFAGIFTTWFVDFVLPLEHLGFRHAFGESWRRLHRYPLEHAFIYGIRVISVVASLLAWLLIVRFLAFPAVLLIGHWLGHTPFKGFHLTLSLIPNHPMYWLSNLGQLGITGLFLLMCASPLLLPFWVLQRRLIHRIFAGVFPEY